MNRILLSIPAWTFTVIAFMLLLYLTLVPKPLPDTDIKLFPHADKVAHAIMFGGIVFCMVLDYTRNRIRKGLSPYEPGIKTTFIFCCISIACGGIIELLQGAMAMGRGADWLDFIADIAGAVIAAAVSSKIAMKMLR